MKVRVVSARPEIDRASDEIIYHLALRVIFYRLSEFDGVWESANKICDRYQLRKAS